MKRKINCEKARSFSIVKALENLGHFPIKESEKEAWFLSVLRSETQASFKVSKTLNRWYDHGLGKGGNVIDLVVLILKCSVQEALEFLANENPIFSFQQQQVILTHVPKVDQETKNKISLLQTKKIEHPALLQYLHSRKIPKEIARNYCSEVWYQYKEKTFFAIGLKNHLGGCELRNKFYKNCSSPKSYTYLEKEKNQLIVVEGMFDLLSLAVLDKELIHSSDILVLNSVSFLQDITQLLPNYPKVRLYLDNDAMGNKTTGHLLNHHNNAIDQSGLFRNFKDINEKLIHGSTKIS